MDGFPTLCSVHSTQLPSSTTEHPQCSHIVHGHVSQLQLPVQYGEGMEVTRGDQVGSDAVFHSQRDAWTRGMRRLSSLSDAMSGARNLRKHSS